MTPAKDPLSVQGIGEVIAARLRDEIMSGQLPQGSPLHEAALAARFGVSRGPIRDALKELADQRLVVALPRRTTIVSPLRKTDIVEVYEVREALEILALSRASERAGDDELRAIAPYLLAIDQALDEGASAAIIAADLDFHRQICLAAGNSRLMTMWETIATQSAVLIGLTSVLDKSLLGGTHGHHQLVLDALVARDPNRAGKILSDHFRIARDVMLAAIGDPPAAAEAGQDRVGATPSTGPSTS